MIYLIYKATHTSTGMVYIGITNQKLKQQTKQHMKDLHHNRHVNSKMQQLYNASPKFAFKVVDSYSNKEQAYKREQELIGVYYDRIINEAIPVNAIPDYDTVQLEDCDIISPLFDLPIDEVFPEHATGLLSKVRDRYIKREKQIRRKYYGG